MQLANLLAEKGTQVDLDADAARTIVQDLVAGRMAETPEAAGEQTDEGTARGGEQTDEGTDEETGGPDEKRPRLSEFAPDTPRGTRGRGDAGELSLSDRRVHALCRAVVIFAFVTLSCRNICIRYAELS